MLLFCIKNKSYVVVVFYFTNLQVIFYIIFLLKHNRHRSIKINGYTQVVPSENALLCATAKQPTTVSLNATDFQFYHRVSFIYLNLNKILSVFHNFILVFVITVLLINFYFFPRQGIYDGDNCPKDSTNTNHIALVVGYDSKQGKDYWIVKNSWGENWGMKGYIFIQRRTKLPYGVCSINAWAFYPNKNQRTTQMYNINVNLSSTLDSNK